MRVRVGVGVFVLVTVPVLVRVRVRVGVGVDAAAVLPHLHSYLHDLVLGVVKLNPKHTSPAEVREATLTLREERERAWERAHAAAAKEGLGTGWAVNGIFPIFMATIPSESVDAHHHATVLGLAMGACEILGGVFGPPVAGMLNDAFGADTFLWMLLVLAVISGFVATGLRETAPMALARRGSLSVVSP